MYKREFTLEQIREAASHQTRELHEAAKDLVFWLDGVHHLSEGQYLEYVVRSYLRKRVPRRFEVSTGFISTLETNAKDGNEPGVTRRTSRQFDILIWDADAFPPLLRADEFVIVVPESVRAIIEVTKKLNPKKAREDLEKFDDLHELYSYQRLRFRPYTAMVAISSTSGLTKLLRILEQFYLFHSSIPIPFRYNTARSSQNLDWHNIAMPDFMDSICLLDKGLIKGGIEFTDLDRNRRIVRYTAYSNKPNVKDSFGFFERDLILALAQTAAKTSGYEEPSVDVYREFKYPVPPKAEGSLIIEDWESLMPSLNVMEKAFENNSTPNVSDFFGADFMEDHPNPVMFLEQFDSKAWAFERHSEHIFACGQYKEGSRANSWRICIFDEERKHSSMTEEFKISELGKDFLEFLHDLEIPVWDAVAKPS